MSDVVDEAETETSSGGTKVFDEAETETSSGGTKVFDEAYVKKLRDENARYRTEAKKNADAAARLAEVEAEKADLEKKSADLVAELEAKLGAAQGESTRARIQATYGISDEDADLFLTATDPEKLEAQAKALADRESSRKKNGPVLTHQTTNLPESKTDPLREFAQQIFNT